MEYYAGLASIISLSLAILLVWAPQRNAWIIAFLFFIASALYSSWIKPIALISILVFAVIIWRSLKTEGDVFRYLLNGLVIITALVAGIHLAPGFDHIHLLEETRLSENTGWSSLRFSADKPTFGLFLLVAYRDRLCKSYAHFTTALKLSLPIIVVGMLSVYILGLLLGFVVIDITFSVLVIVWFARNLIFTVIAEELLFRGFIQQKLQDSITHKHSNAIALFVASILFGLVHIYGGWEYGLLATLAGLMYGYVYMKTGRLEMAFIGHVALNAGHVMLLSYP